MSDNVIPYYALWKKRQEKQAKVYHELGTFGISPSNYALWRGNKCEPGVFTRAKFDQIIADMDARYEDQCRNPPALFCPLCFSCTGGCDCLMRRFRAPLYPVPHPDELTDEDYEDTHSPREDYEDPIR